MRRRCVDGTLARDLEPGGHDRISLGSRDEGWSVRRPDHVHTRKEMTRQIVFTPEAARPPATYSQAVKAAGLVFVSGTAPADPVTGHIKGTTIQEQTRQCLANIAAILEAAGSSMDKIVSATVVMAEEEDFAGMNEEWLKWFPSNPPARQGAKLPVKVPGLKVSIAAIAEA
jgi:2-iminobutanoate/2-iminopropanoate deaminase